MLPPPENFFAYDISVEITRFLLFSLPFLRSYYIIFRYKTRKKSPVYIYLSMKDVEKSEVRLLTSDLCRLFVSASHRNILESSSSVIFPIQLSPTETVMSARDLFFWMISLIFSSKVFFVMKRWTRTLFFCPMR